VDGGTKENGFPTAVEVEPLEDGEETEATEGEDDGVPLTEEDAEITEEDKGLGVFRKNVVAADAAAVVEALDGEALEPGAAPEDVGDAKHDTTVLVTTMVTVTVSGPGVPAADKLVPDDDEGIPDGDTEDDKLGEVGLDEDEDDGRLEPVAVGTEPDVSGDELDTAEGERNGIGKPVLVVDCTPLPY
jgi:hypothetical protein